MSCIFTCSFYGPKDFIKPNGYDFTEEAVVIGEGKKTANVFPMKSGVKKETLEGSWQPTYASFGRDIKMLKKVCNFVRVFSLSLTKFCYYIMYC